MNVNVSFETDNDIIQFKENEIKFYNGYFLAFKMTI